jgi:hypothetical protein
LVFNINNKQIEEIKYILLAILIPDNFHLIITITNSNNKVFMKIYCHIKVIITMLNIYKNEINNCVKNYIMYLVNITVI